MTKVQQVLPKDIQVTEPGKLTKIARAIFPWTKPKKIELSKVSAFAVYCRTSSFYDAAAENIHHTWYEAHEGKDGYWTMVKKTKTLDAQSGESAEFKYKGTVVSKKITFDQVLKDMHAYEQGAKALNYEITPLETEHFYQNVGEKDGFCFGMDDLSVWMAEEKVEQGNSQEKIIKATQLAIIESLGRSLDDANTEKGLYLPNLFSDQDYQKKVQDFATSINRFSEGVENILLSISRIVDAGEGNVKKIEFADLSDGEDEFEFNFPLIGKFDYTYGKGGVDRCNYQYADDEWAYTGPFAVEKYVEYSQKTLDTALGFLPPAMKQEIQIFFLESALTASLAHARNLFHLDFCSDKKKQHAALNIEKDITKKLIEKLKGFSNTGLIERELTTIFSGMREEDKSALKVPQKFKDLLDGLRAITCTAEYARENAAELARKTKIKKAPRVRGTSSAGPG